MADFAKLFNTEKHGQIVVMNGNTEDGDPAVYIFFSLPELCFFKLSINFTAGEWDAAGAYFADITEERAVSVISASLDPGVFRERFMKGYITES